MGKNRWRVGKVCGSLSILWHKHNTTQIPLIMQWLYPSVETFIFPYIHTHTDMDVYIIYTSNKL